MLMDSALGEHGKGVPANLVVNHKVLEASGVISHTSYS